MLSLFYPAPCYPKGHSSGAASEAAKELLLQLSSSRPVIAGLSRLLLLHVWNWGNGDPTVSTATRKQSTVTRFEAVDKLVPIRENTRLAARICSSYAGGREKVRQVSMAEHGQLIRIQLRGMLHPRLGRRGGGGNRNRPRPSMRQHILKVRCARLPLAKAEANFKLEKTDFNLQYTDHLVANLHPTDLHKLNQ